MKFSKAIIASTSLATVAWPHPTLALAVVGAPQDTDNHDHGNNSSRSRSSNNNLRFLNNNANENANENAKCPPCPTPPPPIPVPCPGTWTEAGFNFNPLNFRTFIPNAVFTNAFQTISPPVVFGEPGDYQTYIFGNTKVVGGSGAAIRHEAENGGRNSLFVFGGEITGSPSLVVLGNLSPAVAYIYGGKWTGDWLVQNGAIYVYGTGLTYADEVNGQRQLTGTLCDGNDIDLSVSKLNGGQVVTFLDCNSGIPGTDYDGYNGFFSDGGPLEGYCDSQWLESQMLP